MTADELEQYRALADADSEFVVIAPANLRALLAEVERLRGELAAEQARPKLEPTDAENEAAAARIERMNALFLEYGPDKTQWPLALLRELRELSKQQDVYEARYCQEKL